MSRMRPLSVVLAVLCLSAALGAAEMRNGGLRLDWSEKTGQVEKIFLRGVWRSKADIGNTFAVFAQREGDEEGKWIPFEAFKLINPPAILPEAKSIVSAYSAPLAGGSVFVRTTTTAADDNTVRFRIEVENKADIPILRVRYPTLKNLSFTAKGEGDQLLWPLLTTMLVENPSKKAKSIAPLHYPRAVLNYVDVSGGGAGVALIGDPSLIMNQYNVTRSKRPGAVDLHIEMIDAVKPGDKAHYEFVAFLHGGNWRKAADYYRAWFYKRFPKPDYPEWARYANGYLSAMWGMPFPPQYGKDTRRHINETWRLGMNHLQFWGQTGNHACPGYSLPDPLRGGEQGMTKMFRQIRAAGLHTGGYFWSNGISKFVALSSSYRGVKWEEFPKELRAPSWDWLVKNSLYATPARTAPSKEIKSNSWKRAKVKTVAEAEAKKLAPQALHSLSFHSPEFRDLLRFWVSRYVRTYGADVPYLDVYGHRPKYVAHNPYLGKFGDGTEGKLRYAFLTGLLRELRKDEKNLVVMIEGAIDAYNIHAPALISNNRRFMEGYRYTHPGSIFYEGHANGWWSYDKSLEATANAYLDGNRFDLIFGLSRAEGERIVWLRDSLVKWIADGTYQGRAGFKLSSDKVKGAFIDGSQALGSSLMNFRNMEKTPDTVVRIGAELRKGYQGAFMIPLYGEIKYVPDLAKPVRVPATTVSSLLMVKAPAPHAAVVGFVLPEMTADGLRYDTRIVNLGSRAQSVKLTVDFLERRENATLWATTVEGRAVAAKFVTLPPKSVADKVERLLFTFDWGSGKARLRRTFTPVAEDPGFEWDPDLPLVTTQAKQGASSVKIEGNTREKVYLKLAPKTAYKMRLALFKTAESRPEVFVWDSRQRKVVARFRGASGAKTGEWGEIAASFTTADDGWLYVTLKNKGQTPVYFDDLRIDASK